jgi:hypothetical protein
MIDEPSKPKRGCRWAIIVFVAFLTLGGLFFFSQSFSSRAAKLRPGMTKQEVFAVMGQPDRLMKLGKTHIALFTPLPFDLHALFTKPGQALAGNSSIMATEFPAYVEFEDDIATRVRVDGHEVEAASLSLP